MEGSYGIPKEYLQVLRVFSDRMGDSGVNWTIIGSLSLASHGVPLVPRDIDILTDKNGSHAIENIFPELVNKNSLEREYEEYVKLGRLDTAKYIKKFMVRGK